MTDSETGPAEREVTNLRFQQMTRLKVFKDKPETLTPEERRQLLAISNKYGYTFVGCDTGLKILKTSTIHDLNDKNQDNPNVVVSDYQCWDVALSSQPVHVALSGDDLTLSVCSLANDGLSVALFDVRTLVHKSASAAPFTRETLAKGSDTLLVSLLWNPTNPAFFATCLSNGTLALWDCSAETIRLVAASPNDVVPTAMCWSPKGKQIVVGTSTGQLVQFDQAIQPKKVTPAADFTSEPIKVVDILWLSTYMFAVAYIDAEETLQPNLAIVTSPKEGRPTFANYEDICYGMGEARTAQYPLLNLDKMGFIVAFSSNSSEAAVVGRCPGNKSLWEIWTLDDAARIAVPLSTQDEDTFPMGTALDLTCQAPIKIGITTYQPPPVIMVLSTEGLLCPFHVLDAEAKETITTKTLPLPTEGERVGKVGLSQATVSKPAVQPSTTNQTAVFTATLPTAKPTSASTFSFGSSSAAAAPKPAAVPAAAQPPSGSTTGFSLGASSSTPFMFGSKGESAGGGVKPGAGLAAPFGASKSLPSLGAAGQFQLKVPASQEAGQPVQVAPQPSLAPSAPPSSTSFNFSQPKTVASLPSGFGSGSLQTDSAMLPTSKPFEFGQQQVQQPQTGAISVPGRGQAGQGSATPQTQGLAPAALPQSVAAVSGPPNQVAPPGPSPAYQSSKPSGPSSTGLAPRPPPPAYSTPVAGPPPVSTTVQAPPAPSGASSTGGTRPARAGLFTGTPVEAAYLSNLIEEIEHFGKELAELRSHTQRSHVTVGDRAEHEQMKKMVDTLVKFRAEVLDVTKSHNEEVHELRGRLLTTFAQLEDARSLRQRNNDPRYLQLLRLRALDPQTASQLHTIRANSHYLETGLADVHGCLDTQWADYHQRKSRQEGRKLGIPTMDTIYQTLSHHYNILISQRGRLEELRQALLQARRYDITEAPWESGVLPSPSGRPGDLSSLTAQLSSTQITSPLKATGTPVSSKKQAQLRKALSRRATTPRRTTSRVDISDLGSPVPSHGSHDTSLFQAFANRRLQYREEETVANERDRARPLAGEGVPKLAASQPSRPSEGPGVPVARGAVPRPMTAVSAPAPSTALAKAPIQASVPAPAPPTTTTVTTNPSPSSFALTGRGTVVWGDQATPTKPTARPPAGATAATAATTMTATSTGQRRSSERQPELPPVVNIKNLDIKQDSNVPPVSFTPVNNSVDAGTAKVVKEVLAEITKTSRVGQPDAGSPAGLPSVIQPLPLGTATAASAAAIPTTTSATAKPPAGMSFSFPTSKPASVQPFPTSTLTTTTTISNASKVAPSSAPVFIAPTASSAPDPSSSASSSLGSKQQGAALGSAGLSFGKLPVSSTSASSSLFGSSIFGSKGEGGSAPPNASAAALPTNFSFGPGQRSDTPQATPSVEPTTQTSTAARLPFGSASSGAGSANSLSFGGAPQPSGSAPSLQHSSSSSSSSSSDSLAGAKPGLFSKDQQSAASLGTPSNLFTAAPTSAKLASDTSQKATTTPTPGVAVGVAPGGGTAPSSFATPASEVNSGQASALAKPGSEAMDKAKPSKGGISLQQPPAGQDSAGTGLANNPTFSGEFGASTIPPTAGTDDSGTGLQTPTSATDSTIGASVTAPSSTPGTGLFGAAASSSNTGLFGAKPEGSAQLGASTTATPTTTGTIIGFGSPFFGAAPSAGLFGAPKFGAAPAPASFGAPATTSAAATTAGTTTTAPQPTVTSAEPAKAKGPTTLFGLLKEDTPEASSTPTTTTDGSSSAGGTGLFGQASTTAASTTTGLFGQSSGASGGLFGQQPSSASSVSTAGSSGGLFGKPATTSSTGGLFGQPTAATTGGLFGQAGAAASSSSGGLFGKGTPSSTTTASSPFQQSSSSGGLFGAPAASGSPAFGQQQSTGVFGSSSTTAPAFGQTPSPFGQSTTNTSSSSGMFGGGNGGGFFSGLGGRPNPEAAQSNPFGTPAVSSSAFGSPTTPTGGSSMFGGQSTQTFGSGENNSGSVFGAESFSSPGVGVGKAGFGGFNKPAAAPAPAATGFGSPPSFGNAPAFGSTPSFGGSAFGSSPTPNVFGPTSGFGAGASQGASSAPTSGFGGFAQQETPTFGALSGGGAKPPQSSFGGFGATSSQPSFGGFGNSAPSNPSEGFSGSSSFTQYR